jgi:mutator protein MutT
LILENPRPLVHVVAAAVLDGAGRILIAQRPDGKHLAGGWEFPGGKLEFGESRQEGLARELREELGITAHGIFRPLIRVQHAYPTRDILLDVFVVKSFSGELQGLDGQALRWCNLEELAAVKLLPADGPIVRALRLPERLEALSSDAFQVSAARVPHDGRLWGAMCAGPHEALDVARTGPDFLVLTAEVAASELRELCGRIPVPIYARGLEMEQAWELGASGINDAAVTGAGSRRKNA